MYMSGLGVMFNDLPRQGQNLRLYTYDPPGSAFYSPSGFIYNTGHYDAMLPAGPCSQTDAQGFNDPASMNSYAGARGEILVLVTRNDIAGLCAYRPQVQAAVSPAAPPPVAVAPILAPTGSDTGSISVILRGGPSSNISQPQTPGVFTAPTPSAPLDLGPQLPTGIPIPTPDLSLIAVAGLAVLLLAGRGRRAS